VWHGFKRRNFLEIPYDVWAQVSTFIIIPHALFTKEHGRAAKKHNR